MATMPRITFDADPEIAAFLRRAHLLGISMRAADIARELEPSLQLQRLWSAKRRAWDAAEISVEDARENLLDEAARLILEVHELDKAAK